MCKYRHLPPEAQRLHLVGVRPAYTYHSDVYCIGVILPQLLLGNGVEEPFILKSMLAGEYCEYDHDVFLIIEGCLRRKPTEKLPMYNLEV